MKKLFPGYYSKSESAFKNLWENSIIVLDANAYLDLFRLSKESSNEVMSLLKKLDNRLWIPYQAAYEYHKNLYSIIDEQLKKYEESKKQLLNFKASLDSKRAHPHISEQLYKKFEKVFKEINKAFIDLEAEEKNLFLNNPIKEDLGALLTGKVGEEFTKEEKDKILEEGKIRYENRIPPGYKDSQKSSNQFGDLFLWKECIKYSKKCQKPMIIVTNDEKEDWFLRQNGLTIGPRPELIKEFMSETGNDIHLYSLRNFLTNAINLGCDINPTTIAEVDGVKFLSEDFENQDSNSSVDSLGEVNVLTKNSLDNDYKQFETEEMNSIS